MLSGGWVPLNPEHFVAKEAFNLQVLFCLKHLDMAAQSSNEVLYNKLIDILHD